MNNRVLAATCLLWTLRAPLRANFGGYEAGNASTGNVQPLAMVEDVFRPAGIGEVRMQDEPLQINAVVLASPKARLFFVLFYFKWATRRARSATPAAKCSATKSPYHPPPDLAPGALR